MRTRLQILNLHFIFVHITFLFRYHKDTEPLYHKGRRHGLTVRVEAWRLKGRGIESRSLLFLLFVSKPLREEP